MLLQSSSNGLWLDLLILHPNIQSRAQQEISATVCNRSITDSDIPKLHYLQAIVKEVLRMHPPGPLSWARLATQDVHVGKFIVPAGTTAMVNMWAITHNGSIWSDPWDFRPERFIEKDVSVMGSDLRFAPFGSGHRICPGRVLALATVHLWVARFLQEYDWVSSQHINLMECLRLSMEMKEQLVCKLYKR